MRTYEKTHPWITFAFDENKLDSKTWMLLGQTQAKCEHISMAPLMPSLSEELHRVYLAKGVHATTAIEGNSLSEEQVREKVDGRLELPPSKEYLGKEVGNIIDACNEIANQTFEGQVTGLAIEDICHFNAMVLNGLEDLVEGVPGKLRAPGHEVRVANYRGAPPEDLGYLLNRMCERLNRGFAPPQENLRIAYGILRAIFAHLYLAWIHPFGDGNGRTARLLELRILLEAGVPKPAAQLLSNHYNDTRADYYRHLRLSSNQTEGHYSFFTYALQGFVDGLNEQIHRIEEQQFVVHWINAVENAFLNERASSTTNRRKRLILDMMTLGRPVPVRDIRNVSEWMRISYENKTQKTVMRDLNRLGDMNLIRATTDGYIPNFEIVLARLPRVLQ
ncbi:MAG: Fic family protein [Anaerolineaceae bacterium]|nr:Fic family protein [Anaerolineaceae bacterium]